MKTKPRTIFEVSNLILDKVDSKIVIGDFLDEMKINFTAHSIQQEPIGHGTILVVLAGIAEMLASQNNIEMPAWVNGSQYYSSEEVYPSICKSEKFKKLIKSETPPFFAKRNYFTSENAFTRI